MEFNYYYGNQADQFSFIRIPRVLLVDPLFESLTIQAKLLYGVLLDRMGISMRNGWFDEQNRVYIIYQISEIQEDLGFSKKKAIDYLTELEHFGLVEKREEVAGCLASSTSKASWCRPLKQEVRKQELLLHSSKN